MPIILPWIKYVYKIWLYFHCPLFFCHTWKIILQGFMGQNIILMGFNELVPTHYFWSVQISMVNLMGFSELMGFNALLMDYASSSQLVTIGSADGFSPLQNWAITWSNADVLPIGSLETNISENWMKIQTSLKRKCTEICCLQKVSHCVQLFSMC